MSIKSPDLIQLPNWLLECKDPINMIQRTARTVFMIGRFYNSVQESFFKNTIETIGKQWANATYFVPALGLVHSIPELINNIHRGINAENGVDKVYRAAQSVLDASAIVQAGLSFVSGLKEFGVMSKEMFPWMPVVSLILFPLDILGIDTAISHLYQGITAKMELDKEVVRSKKTDSLEVRAENITQACQYLIKNRKKLSKSLHLSKEAAIGNLAETVLNGLSSSDKAEQKQAIEKGEAIMKDLRTRIHTKIGLGISSTVAKVATFITTSALLVAAPTIFGPFALVGAAVVGVSSWLFDKMMLNGNPFDASEGFQQQVRKSLHRFGKEIRKMNKEVVNKVQQLTKMASNEFNKNIDRVKVVSKEFEKNIDRMMGNLLPN